MSNNFTSPIAVYLPRKTKAPKRCALNKNAERNWHFQISNQVKVAYCELMAEQMRGVVLRPPIHLVFTLWKASARKTDRSNILCIVEKMFCDSLTHHGCIEDDNDEFIATTLYRTGGIDRKNPRVDVLAYTHGEDLSSPLTRRLTVQK